MLLGIFIYWGWESAVNLNEETAGDVNRPGLAGLISTVILLVTYVAVGDRRAGLEGDRRSCRVRRRRGHPRRLRDRGAR